MPSENMTRITYDQFTRKIHFEADDVVTIRQIDSKWFGPWRAVTVSMEKTGRTMRLREGESLTLTAKGGIVMGLLTADGIFVGLEPAQEGK